jgi:hypothetical protein
VAVGLCCLSLRPLTSSNHGAMDLKVDNLSLTGKSKPQDCPPLLYGSMHCTVKAENLVCTTLLSQ